MNFPVRNKSGREVAAFVAADTGFVYLDGVCVAVVVFRREFGNVKMDKITQGGKE